MCGMKIPQQDMVKNAGGGGGGGGGGSVFAGHYGTKNSNT